MVSARYDVIVVGVGAMGSATLYQLARRGQRVLGLERYDIPHAMGSSHGHTRIIRLAYAEDPAYVPLLQRSYELWRGIQARAGERLLHITGSVDAGPSDSWVVQGSLQSCLQHELPHQVLTSTELAERFPGYRLPPETLAVLQPEGGFLLPERCIVAYVTAAQAEGAEVHGREQVLEWLPLGDGVRVITDHGVYETSHLVVTAGAWNAKLLALLEGLAVPERQVLAWLQPQSPELFTPDRFPVFNLLVEEGRFYGLPSFGVPGFKFGRYHHLEEAVDPDQLQREPRRDDEELLRAFAARYFPGGSGPTIRFRPPPAYESGGWVRSSWLNRSTDSSARWPPRSPGWMTSMDTYWSLSGSSPSSSGSTSSQSPPSTARFYQPPLSPAVAVGRHHQPIRSILRSADPVMCARDGPPPSCTPPGG